MSAAPAGELSAGSAEPWVDDLAAAGVAEADRPALCSLLHARRRRGLALDVPALCDDYRHWLLFQRARDGDAAAAATFETYWRTRLRRCLARSFDTPLIGELTSAFFERAFGSVARSFSWQCPFTAYLQAVLANVVRDEMARRASARRREEPLPDTEGCADTRLACAATPESALLSSERSAIIGRALAALPALDRHVLLATVLDGESGQEVADRLGMKRQALYMRLHRARAALRQALTAAGFACGEVVLAGRRR